MQKDRTLRYVVYFLYALSLFFLIVYFKKISPTEIRFTRWLQGGLGPSLRSVGVFISYPFLIGLMAVYFFFTYNLECFRPRFYYEALVTLNGMCMIAFLKLCILQARPYQISLDVQGLDCECDYGMPSGHSFTVGIMVLLCYYRLEEWLFNLG